MKHIEKHIALLKRLNALPKKLLHKQGQDYTPHLVLYELCHENCFNLNKAAYFVDNPEFNCTKGVAGISKREEGFCKGISDIWDQSAEYGSYMDDSPFNQNVQQFECLHLNECGTQEVLIDKLSKRFEFSQPQSLVVPLKHGNKGTLIYEMSTEDPELVDEYLEDVVHILGFCPVH